MGVLIEAQDNVKGWGSMIWIAAVLTVYSNAVFTTSLAFENFAVSSKISDDLDKYGLGGHPLAIVKPVGWAALAAFGLSVALHLAFVRTAKRKAMGDYESLGESPPGDPTSRSASGTQHGNTPGRMKS